MTGIPVARVGEPRLPSLAYCPLLVFSVFWWYGSTVARKFEVEIHRAVDQPHFPAKIGPGAELEKCGLSTCKFNTLNTATVVLALSRSCSVKNEEVKCRQQVLVV